MHYYVFVTADLGIAGTVGICCFFNSLHARLSLYVPKRSVESRMLYPNSVIS
jgi:hypothetical protein